MRNPAVQPNKLTNRTVVISAVDTVKQIASAKDGLGKTIEIRIDRRQKGTAIPAEGDTWTVTRIGFNWVLESMLSVPVAPAVVGSRAATDQISLSLLAALVQLGLVTDETSP
jgi:hypothetical protein